MKTKSIIITAAAIIFSISGLFANPTGKNLTFFDANGKTLIQPILGEEATEELPLDVAVVFQNIQSELAYQVFDLSELTKPEVEEELPFDLETVFQQTLRGK